MFYLVGLSRALYFFAIHIDGSPLVDGSPSVIGQRRRLGGRGGDEPEVHGSGGWPSGQDHLIRKVDGLYISARWWRRC